MNDTTARFFDALAEAGGTGHATTTAAALKADLQDHLEEPVVGVPLGFDGVTVRDLPIDLDPTPRTLETATTGVTPAAGAIADTGSILLTGAHALTEAVSLYPERHVAVLAASDIVSDLPAAIDLLEREADRETSVVVATGPSATADMGAIVEGVHGPKDVDAFVLTDR